LFVLNPRVIFHISTKNWNVNLACSQRMQLIGLRVAGERQQVRGGAIWRMPRRNAGLK